MAIERLTNISVIDPLGPAFERVKIILFKPFDLGKWFVIGFCAWLAYLCEGGGGGGNGRAQWNINDMRHAGEEVKDYFLENMLWIIPVGILVLLFGIGLWILLTWLSSRGRFMFLHCVAGNKAEIIIPWAKFREHSNSLFLFRIVVGLISLALFSVPFFLIIFFVFALISGPSFVVLAIPGLIIAGFGFLVLAILFWLVHRFTMDFTLPIMFLRTTSCTTAWREFLIILSANKVYFVLYALFRLVIGITIVTIITLGFCIGCCLCCASVLLLIPYIGTVILLPVFVFERSYSLNYLRQFGTQFDVFRTETANDV